MSAFALNVIFPDVVLVANQSGTTVEKNIRIEEVEILFFPLGTAVLKFLINWKPHRRDILSLEELRSWIYLSKFRHKVEVFEGWILNNKPLKVKETQGHHDCLGTRIIQALYSRKPASLSAIGNWLLMKSDEDAEYPPQRLGRFSKRCYHSTVVVVDHKPPPALLKEYLFHLKRALGQKNRPPPLSGNIEDTSTDRILRPRSNRYIGMSREGIVSLSWPSEGGKNDYEVGRWHKVFFGIYLLLATHVLGEKAILLELSNISAFAGSLLKSISSVREDTNFEEGLKHISEMRNTLGSIAALMTRYTLQMSSDDCGGLSEYVEFFSALRNIFGIRKQRNELREEIQDVLALVESSYIEEQRILNQLSAFARREEKRQSKIRDDAIAAKQSRFNQLFAITSIFTLPIVILGSIFGMNLDDLPVQVPFFPAMGATLALSSVLLILFVSLSCCTSKLPETEEDPIVTSARASLSLELDRMRERVSLDIPGGPPY